MSSERLSRPRKALQPPHLPWWRAQVRWGSWGSGYQTSVGDQEDVSFLLSVWRSIFVGEDEFHFIVPGLLRADNFWPLTSKVPIAGADKESSASSGTSSDSSAESDTEPHADGQVEQEVAQAPAMVESTGWIGTLGVRLLDVFGLSGDLRFSFECLLLTPLVGKSDS